MPTYTHTWPTTLPQSVLQDGYSETPGIQIETYQMDAGPAKTQFCGIDADILPCSIMIDDTQLETLRTFVYDTLMGASRFGIPHPRKRDMVAVKFMPNGDKKLYVLTPLGYKRYRADFTLMVLP